jgi:hypothetical protein
VAEAILLVDAADEAPPEDVADSVLADVDALRPGAEVVFAVDFFPDLPLPDAFALDDAPAGLPGDPAFEDSGVVEVVPSLLPPVDDESVGAVDESVPDVGVVVAPSAPSPVDDESAEVSDDESDPADDD